MSGGIVLAQTGPRYSRSMTYPQTGCERPQPNSPARHPRLLCKVRDALYRLAFPKDCGLRRQSVQVIATRHMFSALAVKVLPSLCRMTCGEEHITHVWSLGTSAVRETGRRSFLRSAARAAGTRARLISSSVPPHAGESLEPLSELAEDSSDIVRSSGVPCANSSFGKRSLPARNRPGRK